jgi:ankyrin repeat protein
MEVSVSSLSERSLPEQPHLDHLRKQAKDLLRQCRAGDPAALAQVRQHLPAAKNKPEAELGAMALALQLRDAQSCVARQYGFSSWNELKQYVDWKNGGRMTLSDWVRLLYAGDIAGGNGRARPAAALRVLAENPQLAQGDASAYVACALGDDVRVGEAIDADPAWVNRPGGPLKLPPLVAVTHSSLAQDDRYRDKLRRCVRLLLDAGANPNQAIGNRFSPHSLDEPGEDQLTALYGAAGQAHDPEMTRLLLVAGANPNDNESLYHAVGSTACVRLLLEHGARPDSNILANAIAHTNLDVVRLLIERGADPNEPGAQRISPLLFAIRSRRPAEIVKALLAAGANPRVQTPDGQSAYKYALAAGLPEIAALLAQARAEEVLSVEDAFVAACARCDEAEARRLLSQQPDMFNMLGARRLRGLPEMVWTGCDEAARLMVRLGWPIAARGGDEPFFGSALNWAVFRGNAAMTEFLLRHGASWTERHGYNDNVIGTLAWSSLNQPPDFGDWVGCALALVAHGMPTARRPRVTDPTNPPRWVEIDGRGLEFSEEVTEALLAPAQRE